MISTTEYRAMRRTHAVEIEKYIDGAITRAAVFQPGSPITINLKPEWPLSELRQVLDAYKSTGWHVSGPVFDQRDGNYIQLEAR